MRLLATEPASIAKILDVSIKLYAACFGKLIGIISILAVLYIATGLASLKFQTDPSAPPEEALKLVTENLPLFGTIVIVSSLVSMVLYVAILFRVDNFANEREDTVGEAVSVGLKKLPSFFFAVILYILVVILGYILLIIPGLILTLSLMFYLYFIVVDGYGAYGALKASHSLVWGHWWRTTAVFTVPMVIWLALFFTLGFAMALLAANNQVLLQIIANLLSVVFTPYLFTLGYVQFQDLKLRKSGSDLASRLAG